MNKIIYIFFLLSLFACTNKNNITNKNTLIIPKKIYSFSNNIEVDLFFKNIYTIHLETKPEILIKNIFQIYLYNNLFFIFHDSEISIFDFSGKFVRKIGKQGNGPGEYIYLPQGVAFHNKYIYLSDYLLEKIFVYNIQGEYIKSINTNRNITQLKILNDTFLIGYTPNCNGHEPNKLYFYTMDGIAIDSIKNDIIYKNFKSSISFTNEHPMFITHNNLIGFKEVLSDTLYSINSNLSLNPFLLLNLGDIKLTPDDIYNQKDIFKSLDHGKKVLEIFFDNENYTIFHDRDSRYTCIIWDKEKQKVNNAKFIYNKDLAKQFNKEKSYIQIDPKDESSRIMTKDGTPYFMPKYVSEDNKYLIGYETSATNDDGNPIIVLAEMK